MAFPETSIVKTLNEVGDASEISRRAFESLFDTADTVRFQAWLNDSEDLFCAIERKPNFIRLYFGFNGMDAFEIQRIGNALLDYACAFSPGEVAGIVIDEQGLVAEYDWDKFFLISSVPPPWIMPSLLGFPIARWSQVSYDACRVRQCGDLVILTDENR